jgi:hypothetical protein
VLLKVATLLDEPGWEATVARTKIVGGLALVAMLAGAGTQAGTASAVPLPPKGATEYQLTHTWQPFTTSGGYAQVRISGIASTWVTKMPKRPSLVPDPHEIYQQVKVSSSAASSAGGRETRRPSRRPGPARAR